MAPIRHVPTASAPLGTRAIRVIKTSPFARLGRAARGGALSRPLSALTCGWCACVCLSARAPRRRRSRPYVDDVGVKFFETVALRCTTQPPVRTASSAPGSQKNESHRDQTSSLVARMIPCFRSGETSRSSPPTIKSWGRDPLERRAGKVVLRRASPLPRRRRAPPPPRAPPPAGAGAELSKRQRVGRGSARRPFRRRRRPLSEQRDVVKTPRALGCRVLVGQKIEQGVAVPPPSASAPEVAGATGRFRSVRECAMPAGRSGGDRPSRSWPRRDSTVPTLISAQIVGQRRCTKVDCIRLRADRARLGPRRRRQHDVDDTGTLRANALDIEDTPPAQGRAGPAHDRDLPRGGQRLLSRLPSPAVCIYGKSAAHHQNRIESASAKPQASCGHMCGRCGHAAVGACGFSCRFDQTASPSRPTCIDRKPTLYRCRPSRVHGQGLPKDLLSSLFYDSARHGVRYPRLRIRRSRAARRRKRP